MELRLQKLFGAAAAFALLASGCSTESDTPPAETTADISTQQQTTATETSIVTQPQKEQQTAPTSLLTAQTASIPENLSGLFSDRDLSGTYDTPDAVITCLGDSVSIEGEGAAANGSDITITQEGIYRITGTLQDGQLLVNTDGKVQLVLDGVSLSCSDSAPIYVQQADKCFLTLADGTENTVSDGSTYVYAQEGSNEPDAAIFSADSLTLNGSGTLYVKGNYNEGITSKDDIVITGGTIRVEAVGNGIKGKDYVAVAGGDMTVTAGADGIKSNNAEEAGRGFVYVQDGTLTVTAQEDAIQAETELIAEGGHFTLTAGGGSANAAPQMHNDFGGFEGWGGFGNWGNYDETDSAEDTTVSTKTLKAGTLLYIAGGEYTLDSADDGLHSNGNLIISGGTAEIRASGDGIHADAQADFAGGTVHVLQSGEGVEAAGILVLDGEIAVTASDDGFNASDGTAQGGMGVYSDGAALEIAGGSVYVNADGDGLDSNGNMLISDGTAIVDGPTNSGNGALDGNGTMQCTGGLLIAAGSSGMAEYPSGPQNTAVITLDTSQPGGTEVKICNAAGEAVITHTPAKQFNSFIVSSPELAAGETYTVYTNGTEAGSFTVSDTLCFLGEAGSMMGGGFPGGGRGDMGGGRGSRHDMQMPTDENGNITMPEGMELPQDMTMPEGMEPPQDMTMPEGMEPPQNMTMPEGMEPPLGGFPGEFQFS